MKEIILKEDIRSVGHAGEVVKVSDGYARNFLFPQRKGVLATTANLKKMEAEREGMEKHRQKLREEALALAEKIRGIKVILRKETGEEDRHQGGSHRARLLSSHIPCNERTQEGKPEEEEGEPSHPGHRGQNAST